MPETIPVPDQTPGQICAQWLKAAKLKAKESKSVLSWDEVAKIIDATLAGLKHFTPKAVSRPVEAEKSDKVTPEAIYAAYPRKVGKKTAIDSIEKAVKRLRVAGPGTRDATLHGLLSATQQFAQCVSRWPEDERHFIPHPSTWFNQGRYEDDPKEWIRGKPTPPTTAKDYSKL